MKRNEWQPMNIKKKPILQSALCTLVFIGTQMAVSCIGVGIIYFHTAQNSNNMVDISEKVMKVVSSNSILLSIIGNIVFLIILFILFWKKPVKIIKRNVFKSKSSLYFIFSLLSIICFSSFWNITFEIVPALKNMVESMNVMGSVMKSNTLMYILAIYIVGPVAEEITFRGFITEKLRESVSYISAIIISALLFGLAHIMTGNPTIIVFAFIGGIIFGLCYALTDSIILAIVIHMVGNMCELVLNITNIMPPVLQFVIIIILAVCSICLISILLKLLKHKDSKTYND